MKLFVGLVLMSMTAYVHAQLVARAANADGKFIELHDEPCEVSFSMPLAITTNYNGRRIRGCWRVDGDVVTVRWNDGDVIQYPYDAFDMMIPSSPTPQRGPDKEQGPRGTNIKEHRSFNKFEV